MCPLCTVRYWKDHCTNVQKPNEEDILLVFSMRRSSSMVVVSHSSVVHRLVLENDGPQVLTDKNLLNSWNSFPQSKCDRSKWPDQIGCFGLRLAHSMWAFRRRRLLPPQTQTHLPVRTSLRPTTVARCMIWNASLWVCQLPKPSNQYQDYALPRTRTCLIQFYHVRFQDCTSCTFANRWVLKNRSGAFSCLNDSFRGIQLLEWFIQGHSDAWMIHPGALSCLNDSFICYLWNVLSLLMSIYENGELLMALFNTRGTRVLFRGIFELLLRLSTLVLPETSNVRSRIVEYILPFGTSV